MGEIAGTYRVLQAAGTRLGTQAPGGVSTLEPGQKLPALREKQLQVGVKLLDGTVEAFNVEPRNNGQTLLTLVWRRLNLTECDYFGLEFQSAQGCWVWLEPMKPFGRQVPRPRTTVLRLAVKFFPPDPGQLQEEYTRYLFALQLKRDLLEQRLVCADTTAALLTSHLLQSEIGDYDEILDREHLKASEYLPSQGRCLHRILELHQQHVGQTPAESDFQLLEIARKLDLYGIRFHAASDKEGAKINLAVSHMGILVFQGTTKINTFNWSKVRKLSFKRKRFLIKLHPEVHGPYQDTLEFILGSRDESKSFWKLCVEHHTFFRLADQPKPKTKAVLFSRGSSFRYSGRTQKQLVDYIKDGGVRRTPYDRKHSAPHVCVRALTADLPRQSISLTEALQTPAGTSFSRLPASPSPPPGRPELLDAQAPHSNGAAEHSPDVPQPGPGVGFCRVVNSCATGQRLDAGWAGGVSGVTGLYLSAGGPRRGRSCSTLQVSEEFIDDDPADISFFAGGMEAFSVPCGPLTAASPPPCGPEALQLPESAQSSPDRCSTEAVDMNVDDRFNSEDESDFGVTSELLEVKAQASLLQRLLGPSGSSSLRDSQSEASSLSHVPLRGGLSLHTASSTTQSEASSMVNFPACSVRSESSSALHLSDIIDQLEQLSCAPTTAEGSSGTDTDSWDSGAEDPLDVSLFFSNPFTCTGGTPVSPDFQSKSRNLTVAEQTDRQSS